MHPSRIVFLNIAFVAFALGCSSEKAPSGSNAKTLRVAITTSTRDSGLTDKLIPIFEDENDVQVKLVAVGTGKALRLGKSAEVDAVLVHSKEEELKFLEAGHAIRREPVMFNYFEILGPRSDPAQISNLDSIEALRRIHETEAIFISRGDDSGTHQREMQLWKLAKLETGWKNYQETGQGMGPSLMIASQKKGYILCDRGTYLSMKNKVELESFTNKSEVMKNTYGVLCINPEKNKLVNAGLADSFAEFLIRPATQKLIKEYEMDGEPLFEPIHPVN